MNTHGIARTAMATGATFFAIGQSAGKDKKNAFLEKCSVRALEPDEPVSAAACKTLLHTVQCMNSKKEDKDEEHWKKFFQKNPQSAKHLAENRREAQGSAKGDVRGAAKTPEGAAKTPEGAAKDKEVTRL